MIKTRNHGLRCCTSDYLDKNFNEGHDCVCLKAFCGSHFQLVIINKTVNTKRNNNTVWPSLMLCVCWELAYSSMYLSLGKVTALKSVLRGGTGVRWVKVSQFVCHIKDISSHGFVLYTEL